MRYCYNLIKGWLIGLNGSYIRMIHVWMQIDAYTYMHAYGFMHMET